MLLAATMQLGCTPIPYTEAEIDELAEYSHELLAQRLQNMEFERSEIEKCELVVRRRHDHGVDATFVTTRFKAIYPNRSSEPDLKIHDTVECRLVQIFLDSKRTSIERKCSLGVQNLIRFPSVSSEVEVGGEIKVDVARKFLEFLTQRIGETIDRQIFSADQFASISSISGFDSGNRLSVIAVYESNGCSTYTIAAKGTLEPTLTFHDIRRNHSIC